MWSDPNGNGRVLARPTDRIGASDHLNSEKGLLRKVGQTRCLEIWDNGGSLLANKATIADTGNEARGVSSHEKARESGKPKWQTVHSSFGIEPVGPPSTVLNCFAKVARRFLTSQLQKEDRSCVAHSFGFAASSSLFLLSFHWENYCCALPSGSSWAGCLRNASSCQIGRLVCRARKEVGTSRVATAGQRFIAFMSHLHWMGPPNNSN